MSTDNKPTVQQAAKQGNPQAIAILLNHQLQPKGITAKVSVKDSCLRIMLGAANVLNQKALVAAIQKWINSLGIDSIKRVQIYAKQTGEDIPSWNDSFEIVRQLEEPKIANVGSSSTVTNEIVKSDVKREKTSSTSQLDPALLELAKNGDTKVIAELIKNTLQQPDVNVRATLSKGLLQVVIVSNQVPKQDDSVVTISKLVQDFNSSLVSKLKVVGMQEIEGSSNSKMSWQQEIIIDKQLDDFLKTRNLLVKNANNADIDAIVRLCLLEFDQAQIVRVDIFAEIIEKKCLTIDIYSKQELDQNIAVGLVFKALIDLNLNFISNITISSYMSSYMAEKLSYIWSYEFVSVISMKGFHDIPKMKRNSVHSVDNDDSTSVGNLSKAEHPATKLPENVESESIYAISNESIPFRTTSYSNMNLSFIGNRKVVVSLVILVVSIILVSGLLFSSLNKKKLIDSQIAKASLTELKRINSRMEIGINKLEYPRELSNYKFAAETFINSSDSEINLRYTELIKDSLEAHIYALNVWEQCRKQSLAYNCEVEESMNGETTRKSSLMTKLLTRYPYLNEKLKRYEGCSDGLCMISISIDKNDVLQYLWSYAKASEDAASIEISR